MKKILIFLLFPLFMNAQQLVLSDYTIISSGPPEGYERPRIVMTANASPFIIWKKPSTPKSVKAKSGMVLHLVLLMILLVLIWQ